MAKTWVEKRNNGKNPQVKILDKSFAGMKQGSRMLISTPQEVDEFIRSIPPGKLVKPEEMRSQLAKKHKADATCPVSMGIFLRIAVEAAIEERAAGCNPDEVAPFWRIDLEGTSSMKKLSIDAEELTVLRGLDR